MKSTVFTVIAVLLICATAQFAAGNFTVRSSEDEDVWVCYVYWDASYSGEGEQGAFHARGYYKVEPGKSVELFVPSKGHDGLALRIKYNKGQEITPRRHHNGTISCYFHPDKAHNIFQRQVNGEWMVLDDSSPTDGLELAKYWWMAPTDRIINVSGGSFTFEEPDPEEPDPVVTIEGLSLDSGLTRNGKPIPNRGGNAFIILGQYGNTCGPTSLEMVLHYYGKWVTMADIWRAGDIHTVLIGTFPGEMKKALNGLGVPAAWYDWGDDPFGRLRSYVDQNRPPCILLRWKAREYHWVVVVGYNKKPDEYLIADPASGGDFRWISGEQLDAAWGFKTDVDATLWYGGFDVLGGGWLDAGVSFKAQPYTRIVPKSAPTKHFAGLWSEMRAFRMTGTGRIGGSTRGWEKTITFDDKFDFHRATAIEEITSLGTAILQGSEKVGEKSVKLWGRIEDGLTLRGRMQVIVRTYSK